MGAAGAGGGGGDASAAAVAALAAAPRAARATAAAVAAADRERLLGAMAQALGEGELDKVRAGGTGCGWHALHEVFGEGGGGVGGGGRLCVTSQALGEGEPDKVRCVGCFREEGGLACWFSFSPLCGGRR